MRTRDVCACREAGYGRAMPGACRRTGTECMAASPRDRVHGMGIEGPMAGPNGPLRYEFS